MRYRSSYTGPPQRTWLVRPVSSAVRQQALSSRTTSSDPMPAPVHHRPSTRTSRPQEREPAVEPEARVGQSPENVPSQHDVKCSVRPGRSHRVPHLELGLDGCARALALASSTIRGARSRPLTRYPAAASSTARLPVPPPRSAIRAGAAGTRGRSNSAHAARTTGSRRPWSGASSKSAACSSQYAAASTRLRSSPCATTGADADTSHRFDCGSPAHQKPRPLRNVSVV